jgi:hypothetical protein
MSPFYSQEGGERSNVMLPEINIKIIVPILGLFLFLKVSVHK